MRLPNLLATRNGRFAAFFFLYLTEGMPLGFAATAVATQLRRQDVGPAEIGAFVASFYLPWAFKWAFGPVVDVFGSRRWGRRRGWILVTQVVMALTLVSTAFLTLPQQLGLFTAILLVHNTFAAVQDVAIDALAVNTLQEDERGLANGVMFAGAYMGQMLGGAGVLFLSGYTGFTSTFFVVSACILAVTSLIVLPMKETPSPARAAVEGSRLRVAGREMKLFAVESFRSFLGTRAALGGVAFALLPAGAMCLSLALQSNLAVELGMNDDQVAWLLLWSSLLTGAFCVIGGMLSDRLGRRRTLFVYIAGMSLPVLYLMVELSSAGWVMPVSMADADRRVAPAALVTAFWVASLVYAVFQGLMYGTRSAALMDVTNPKVAATQFTAYMAMMNLGIAYSAQWQGLAVEAIGYPRTLLIDALFGLACLLFLPLLKAHPAGAPWSDHRAAARARAMALGLGLMCLAWLPYARWHDALGAAQPIAQTLFTLVFVGSAVFLLAGAAVIGEAEPATRRLARVGMWVAPWLLLMLGRQYVDTVISAMAGAADAPGLKALAVWLMATVPAAAGIVLLCLSRAPWTPLAPVAFEPAREG